jgi:hypothetical protein
MAEAAKVSGQLAANLKNNPEYIVNAVSQAKALGTTLEQTKRQGESLLDFESSIENELKAELLTGQQMNLERARAAALQGDQVTVMKELANQGMTYNKFQNMNVIAQQSYAKALGLTGDELSNQLRKQKIAQEQGKSLAEITKEEALKAEERQTIQDKFNAAIDKLKDMIGNLVAGPLAMFLDTLSAAFTLIGWIVWPIQQIFNLAGMIGEKIASWATAAGPFGIVLKGIAAVAIVLAAYAAYAALAWIPVVGPLLGLAASIGVMAKGFSALSGAKSMGDGEFAPGKAPVISTKENGIFQGTENDEVAVGPGVINAAKRGSKGDGGMTAPNMDLTPLINAINATTAAVNRVHAKDTTVAIDSKKVNNSAMQNSTKTA